MMKAPFKKALFLILPLALLGGGAYAYRQVSAVPPEQRYKLHEVEKGPLVQDVSANGTLNPVTLVNVGTQVSGMVKKLHVDFNDKVEKGQILLELDDSLLAAQARQSAAAVKNAEAALKLASANEVRARALHAQEYVSRQEFDQAVQARESAQAQLALTRAQADKDRVNLGYTIIRSPVSGVVVARSIDLGQTVAASFQTPTLFQIAQDLSAMQIDTSFPEADIGNIKVGQEVRFNVDAYPNRPFHGKVRQLRLNPSTQQNVVTYNVVVSVDNPDQVLMPGMTAYVNIAVAQREEALLVPNAALRYKPSGMSKDGKRAGKGENGKGENGKGENGRTASKKPAKRKKDGSSGMVYVLRDGTPKPVGVTLGITDNSSTEVTGGELKPGDRVLVGDAAKAGGPPSGGAKSVGMRMF